MVGAAMHGKIASAVMKSTEKHAKCLSGVTVICVIPHRESTHLLSHYPA
jgi:mannose/fructose-specific phosphotransferase system component IIA